MKRKKNEKRQAILLGGSILFLFSLLVVVGLIYRPTILDIGAEARASINKMETPHEIGVNRIRQIADGDLNELKLFNKKDAFCQLNIEGRPEDYSGHWEHFFSLLEEKKGITISSWHFQNANSTNSSLKKNIILGIYLRFTPKVPS